MNILIYLVVAAFIGWIATSLMHDSGGLLVNILVAVVGAFLAGYFLTPIFKVGTINDGICLDRLRFSGCRRGSRRRTDPAL